MNCIENLHNRLNKLGIQTTYFANYPWIYLDTINGKKVTEKFMADHGFTVAFSAIRFNEVMRLTDTGEIFKLIRKYAR